MKKITFIALLIGFNLFSQVDIKTSGYYQVHVNDTIVSSHAYQQIAIERALNEVMDNPLADVRITPPYQLRVYFEGEQPIQVKDKVDTLIIVGRSHLIDYANSMQDPDHKPIRYAMLRSIGIVPIVADTLFGWQKIYKLERTETFAKTIYKQLDIPMQIISNTVYDITSTSAQIKVELSSDNFNGVYIEYRKTGDIDFIKTDVSKTKIVSQDLLNPGTEYQYIVHVMYDTLREIASELVTFKTL